MRKCRTAFWIIACLLPINLAISQSVPAVDAARGQVLRAADHSSLLSPDLKPWHMHMNVTVYDELGKNPQQGTMEEWWVAPGKYRVVIAVADDKVILPLPPDAPKSTRTRISYLVNRIGAAVVHPINLSPSSDVFTSRERKFGKVSLSCTETKNSKSPTLSPKTYCFGPGTDVLRLLMDSPADSIAFNNLGKFQGKEVALRVSFAVMGHPLITGQVDRLETFDPSTFSEAFTEPKEKQPPVQIAAGVLTGALIHSVPPTYPLAAKQRRISGSVLLGALIGKDGSISNLFVIYSPDPLLSDAAKDAVKKWQYRPYFLNGEPTYVDTTITINFNLNGGAIY